jgi:simple sugar transport system permease protein
MTPLLLPAINLGLALALSAIVVLLVGENPLRALKLLTAGAFGSGEAIGYTLYYATTFVFTGLAVAVAFHGGLFNIGAEGQAYIGGLGLALVCLAAGRWPSILAIPVAIVASAAFGAAWAFLPAWLQARRGSHIVITTIMFNFIASSLMTYLLVNVLIKPGQQSPETREFAPSTWVPQLHEMLGALGWQVGHSPLNLSSALAVMAAVLVWFYLWRTRWGYALRVFGHSETAAVYGGIATTRTVIVAMAISGALAGLMSVNEIMGVQHRLISTPWRSRLRGHRGRADGPQSSDGDRLASILFGALYQGGRADVRRADLTRDIVVVIRAHHPRVRRVQARCAPSRHGPADDHAMSESVLLVALLAAATVRGATPLVLAALGGLCSERSGVIDIGLEGKMLVAAFAAAAAAAVTGSAWAGLAAGILASVLVGLAHGLACITHHGNQVVSGMALNITMSGLTAVLGYAWFKEGGQTPLLGAGARFAPITLPGVETLARAPGVGLVYAEIVSGHNVLVYIAAIAVPVVAWLIYRTLRLRLRASARIRTRSTSPGSRCPPRVIARSS